MQTEFTVTENAYEVLPTAEYKLRVTNFEEIAGNYGPRIQFTLEVLAGEYKDKTVRDWMSPKVSLGSKPSDLSKLFAAAYGRPLTTDDKPSLNHLLERDVIGVVVAEPRKDGDGEQNNVNGYKPVKGQSPFDADTFSVGPQEAGATEEEESWGDLPTATPEPITAEQDAALVAVCKEFELTPTALFAQAKKTCKVDVTKRSQLTSAQADKVMTAIKLAHASVPLEAPEAPAVDPFADE
jgi:hypothetical protein